MKKSLFKILAVIIVFVMLSGFYINSSSFIEKQNWKYATGTHIGDWLSKNSFKIDNSVIETHQGAAKIIFSYGKELIIQDINTKDKGFYINKNSIQ